MANYLTTDTELTSVANAIRTKGGTVADLTYPAGFVSAINAIPSGGGIDPNYLEFSGDLSYFNYGGKFTPILQTNKSLVSITNVSNVGGFFGKQPDWISIDPTWNDWSWLTVSVPEGQSITNYCYSNGDGNFIYKLPKLRIANDDGTKYISLGNYCFNYCVNVKSLEDAFPQHSNCLYGGTQALVGCFGEMRSLREFPDEVWWKDANNRPITGSTYNAWFSNCYVLDKIENIPVADTTINNSVFNSFLMNGNRLSKITFATNNGTPFNINIGRSAAWNLNTTQIGYAPSIDLMAYGIPDGKKVTDQTSYEALKNDPDWWTDNVNYSRFNHDSAVDLINSLPNNTNSSYKVTIQFNGASGTYTDGGAINTLTAEEIAVATNKNWIISIV